MSVPKCIKCGRSINKVDLHRVNPIIRREE